MSAAADAVRALIVGGVLAIDHDEMHFAEVRPSGERPTVKYLTGDWEGHGRAPRGSWVVVALDPDVAAEVLAEFDSSLAERCARAPVSDTGEAT